MAAVVTHILVRAALCRRLLLALLPLRSCFFLLLLRPYLFYQREDHWGSEILHVFLNIINKNYKNSASADGGPRSRVRARGTLRSSPHRHQRKPSGTCVCIVNFTKFPPFPGQNVAFGGVGGSPKYFFQWIPNIFVT